jgi:hypothetical protein
MNHNAGPLSKFSIIFPIGLLLSIFIFSQWLIINEDSASNSTIENESTLGEDLDPADERQRGAHVFGQIDSTRLQPFIQNNYNWITIVPYGSQKDIDSPTLSYYRGDSTELNRRDSRWESKIRLAHSAGFKVFLKPHIWLHAPADGKWRSDIAPVNENNWKSWQTNYREFILHYAKIAQQNDVELFCIGVELSKLSIERSVFWKTLIQEVRGIYAGKITYAANWYDEYEKITFWKDLDYIGIQAYFPLVKNEYPSVDQISKGWNKHIRDIESIHKKYDRKILFTEMGYKSTADSAIKPWEWIDYSSDQEKSHSIETQANCFEAFFKTVWKKGWFAGVHIWQLRSDFVEGRGKSHLDFTPQGKPAETIIAKGFESI